MTIRVLGGGLEFAVRALVTIARSRQTLPSRRAGPALAPKLSDPPTSARAAGLRYVSDREPGIRRIGKKDGFRYLGPDGRPVRDREDLSRIRALAIPPAWREVWICPRFDGHLQAVGRDARGRKQYRYHPRWRAIRDETKYARLMAFARALPRIRRRVEEDLARPGLPRRKVLATIVKLLETTFLRVGNDEYVRQNRSFGLTTLRDRHVEVRGPQLRFRFRGKGGKEHEVEVNDRRLARIVRRCQDLPGQELFQYVGRGGASMAVDSAQVNEYLRQAGSDDFTAKDFRTWAGTVVAAVALEEFRAFDSKAEAKRNILRAIRTVAERLGNTPAICRKCYIHPAVIDAYLEGPVTRALKKRADAELVKKLPGLRPEEAAVLALLRKRLSSELEAPRRRPFPDPARNGEGAGEARRPRD